MVTNDELLQACALVAEGERVTRLGRLLTQIVREHANANANARPTALDATPAIEDADGLPQSTAFGDSKAVP